MPEYLAPGVYVEEVEVGARPIEGVSTTTTGFVGYAQRGPLNDPTLVTSFAEFQRIFGGFLPGGGSMKDTIRWLAYAVQGFFDNGGMRAYITRVASDKAEASRGSVPQIVGAANTYSLAKAALPGETALSLNHEPTLTDGDMLLLEDGAQSEFPRYKGPVKKITLNSNLLKDYPAGTEVSYDTTPSTLVLDAKKDQPVIYLDGAGAAGIAVGDAITFMGTDESNKVNSFNDDSKVIEVKLKLVYAHAIDTKVLKPDQAFQVKAVNQGTWGDDIKVSVVPTGSSTKTSQGATNTNILYLETVNGMEAGTILTIDKDPPVNVVVKQANRTTTGGSVVIEPLPVTVIKGTIVTIQAFNLVVTYNNDQEFFNDLSFNEANSRFIKNIVNPGSNLIRVDGINQPPVTLQPIPNGLPGWPLSDGDDGIPADGNDMNNIFIGKDEVEPSQRTGLYTLKNVDGISIAAVPGITDKTVQETLVNLCGETMKSCFAVLDPVENAGLDAIKTQRNYYDSSYAALYYPWVYAFDPNTGGYLNVPPSGNICGIYARTDVERGVYKAPANARVNGAFGLEKREGKFLVITDGTQGILNPMGIDCIRNFPGQGVLVWGARTMSSNTLWKYINVRRLFIYIEQSLLSGLRWVVFEPNNENLWARVVQTVSQFLNTLWQQGALMGAAPQDAFFVVCDRTTMTQGDIDNGRLICKVGVAPVKPAEFVIIRIAQWQGGSAISE